MKTKYFQLLAVALSLLAFALPAKAQIETDYITISGQIRDAETKRALDYVTVSVTNTNISTITNTDGVFSIKVKKSLGAASLTFSHAKYVSQDFKIPNNDMHDVRISLAPVVYRLDEVVVGLDALLIVTKAIENVKHNYSLEKEKLTGFYRETIKKRNSYIGISEAITYTLKTPYTQTQNADRVQIYKGRRLISPKASDTLAVKLQGGPLASTYLDAVKEWDLLTDPESLTLYSFTLEESMIIDERPHYIISFHPKVIVDYALLYGKLYIDKETYTFTKVAANLDMSREDKATKVMLKKKPYGLRFEPKELSYEVTYKRQGDYSYISYARSELQFRCDWKRKLFKSNYTIVSEVVITDVDRQDVSTIPSRMAFGQTHSLSDKVAAFYDENFWEDFNIIEPTESLETAISKLRKKVE